MKYTAEEIELIKKVVAKNAKQEDLMFFLEWCERSGFDPLKKEAIFQYRRSRCKKCNGAGCSECNRGYVETPTFIASIEGILNRAQKFPTYAGSNSAVVYENDEFEFDAVSGVPVKHIIRSGDRGKMVAAWCTVYDKTRKPYCYIYLANEYFKITDDGRSDNKSIMQSKAPDLMLLKSVQAIAHRRMYPGPFGGVYIPEEFGGYIDSEGNVFIPPEDDAIDEEPLNQNPKTEKAETKPQAKPAAKNEKPAAMLSEKELKKQTFVAVLNYGETLGLNEEITRKVLREAGYTTVDPGMIKEYQETLKKFAEKTEEQNVNA